MQIINKLPEVIKCIIYDYVSNKLNYLIEIFSDKFIGNPIDLFKSNVYKANLCHINKLTKVKNDLHFIGLICVKFLPSQKILDKLQKLRFIHNKKGIRSINNDQLILNAPHVKNLCIKMTNFIKIPYVIIGLQELNCAWCCNLTELPNIVGLKKLDCTWCFKLTEIPNIVGLLELDCYQCSNLIEIPNILGLQKLDCSFCNITEIPHIVGLKKLEYIGCKNLIKIPDIIN